MKICVGEAETMEVSPEAFEKDGFYVFPCGCRFQTRDDLPPVHGQHKAVHYDLENVSLDCPATWDLIGSGRTKGIFQLESSLGRGWAKKLKPRHIEHLSALVALLRPGVLKAKDAETGLTMTELYVKRKNGELEVPVTVPAIDEILNQTFGVMIYQEAMMALARVLAGFDLVQVDSLRKAAGKKDQALMSEMGKLFVEMATKHGIITKEQAEALFENIKKSGRYLFNKCSSCDTKVLRPGGGTKSDFTVEEMYRIRTDISYAKATGHLSLYKKWKRLGHYGYGLSLGDDGLIRPNVIESIMPAGFKPVYKITLENRATIRVTGNHKFPTDAGEMTVDQLLGKSIEEWCGYRYQEVSLYVKGDYEPTDFKAINRFSPVGMIPGEKAKPTKGWGQGEDNPGYTNGSYTKYQEFRRSTPNVCFNCGATPDTAWIETHHINGDRTNSEADNLRKLCASCHKKEQYRLGRVRKNEKGYPHHLISIASIRPDGECMTYDVTMRAPHHNFVVDSGIVTCNSHSVSYAINAFWSAHWKAHFPLYFFCAYLFWAKEKQDPLKEMRGLINEAKHFGIEVLPPRFAELRPHFGTDGVRITFGLADVRGIGEAQVRKMQAGVDGAEEGLKCVRSEWSWFDYLVNFSSVAGSIATRRMIEVGGFRDMGGHRVRMLAEFDAYDRLSPKEQESIAALHQPLYKQEIVKEDFEYEEEVAVYDKAAMKAYKAELKAYNKVCHQIVMTQEGELGLPDEEKGDYEDPPKPPHPQPIGTEVQKKTKKVSVKDENGDVLYKASVDAQGESILLDGPREVSSLEEALQGILARPGAVTTARRPHVESLLQMLVDPPQKLVDKPYWIAKKEEENLGIPLTCSNVSTADASIVNCTVKEFLMGKGPKRRGDQLILAVEVQDVREFEIKNGPNRGAKMGRLAVADDTGLLEDVVVFSDAWGQYGHMLARENTVVAIGGKPHWNPDDKSFVVETVWEI